MKMLQVFDKRRGLEKPGTVGTDCFPCSLWPLARQPPVLCSREAMSSVTPHLPWSLQKEPAALWTTFSPVELILDFWPP